MKTRTIIFYWLLILVPAAIIGVAAFLLLSHEQERINKLAIASAEDRTRTIAETLQITVEAIEDELGKALLEIPKQKLQETLLEWERTNPLVRNVFIWDENVGLRYPLPGTASTSEERHFMSRFDGLFSGRVSWPEQVEPSARSDALSAGAEGRSKGLVQDIRKIKESSRQLLKMAKVQAPSSTASVMMDEEVPAKPASWMPWFAENRLYILGWVKKNEGPVYGVELELMTLLSMLITNFPQTSADQFAYVLMDDAGRVLYQSGRVLVPPESGPIFSVSLGPHLPHWELAVYANDIKSPVRADKGFLILGLLLLAVFIAAIIIGGSLLTWQAHRNMTDARQKISFVSNVSHELKTPLTSIRMFAELLLTDRVRSPEKEKHYLQVIVSESRRLTRLLNNVLDFGRLEQGRKTYHLEEVELEKFVTEILESQSLRLKEAKMELKTSFPDKQVIVNVDRDAMEQVILNLIDNAIKYADTGAELSVSMAAGDQHCEIRVEDKGPGVPEAHQHKIFEKFHRVDNSLTSKQQGSGLGLSIARRLLKDLGGNLVYEPGENGGSRFVVRIPVCHRKK
jgi:signal transduction histidine kinase